MSIFGDAQIEPSADMRAVAKTVREFYVALINEGFPRKDALALVSHLLTSAARGDA